MTGQSIVSGTIASYAGGVIIATFQSQGGGAPSIRQVSGHIAADGTFSIQAWDNSNAIYAPSVTNFQIQVGNSTYYSATTEIVGTTKDISSILAAATPPPAAIGSVQVTNTPSTSGKVLTSTSTTAATWQ